MPCGQNPGTPPDAFGPYYWARTSVLEPVGPDGRRVRRDYYFNVFGAESSPKLAAFGGVYQLHFGYAGTAGRPSDSDGAKLVPVSADESGDDGTGQSRYLAGRVYSGCSAAGDCSSGTLLQSMYLRHCPYTDGACSADSTRIVHENDAGCGTAGCYTEETLTGKTGGGLFRLSTTGTNFPAPGATCEGSCPHRTTSITKTLYPEWPAADRADPSKPWITGTYTERERTEDGRGIRSLYDFDSATGALRGLRLLKDLVPGPDDVLTVFRRDGKGNVIQESHYGGDSGGLPLGPCCAAPAAAPQYVTRFTYSPQNFLTRTEALDPASCSSADQPQCVVVLKTYHATVDAASGLVTALEDAAGVVTSFGYDASWRLTKVTPGGAAIVDYAYDSATQVTEKFQSRATPPVTLKQATYMYDGLGRLVSERFSMPAGGTSRRERTYDHAGRLRTISEQGAAAALPVTTFSYDPFGRAVLVVAPDGTKRQTAFAGTRQGEHFLVEASAGALPQFRSRHVFDDLGRLRQVIEKTAPAAVDMATTYGYDPGGRLTTVTMRSTGGVSQSRTFNYDGRGFLRWEEHPESSMTSYTYDAKGHVRTKEQSAARTLFDLRYRYDPAERLIAVEGRNPFAPSEYRTIKAFEFATANGVDQDRTDRRNGKLLRALRYNYPASQMGRTFLVTETYGYADDAGRRTKRTTRIEKNPNDLGLPAWQEVRSIVQSIDYDDLSAPSAITYPVCVNCAHSPAAPARKTTTTYDQGFATGLSDFVSSITYHDNGMRHRLQHTNLMADTQTVDPSGMPRPGVLESKYYDGCTAPAIVSESSGGLIPAAGTFELWANVSSAATTPLTARWFDARTGTALAPPTTAGSNYIAHFVSQPGEYYVEVTNRCRTIRSSTIKVDAGSCVAPWIHRVDSASAAAGYELSVDAKGTGPLTYVWRRTSDDSVIPGNGARVVVTPQVTTMYSVTVTHACSGESATAYVTVTIPLPPPANVVAAKEGGAIKVAWTHVSGATAYTIQRFRPGQGWFDFAQDPDAASPFVDAAVEPGKTYAYRVIAREGFVEKSAPSAADLATMMPFTTVTQSDFVRIEHFDELLAATNAVRATVGWAAVTWDTILSPQDPVPIRGGVIMKRHVLALRSRMNEALHALGIRVAPYTDPDLTSAGIRDEHIRELQERTR